MQWGLAPPIVPPYNPYHAHAHPYGAPAHLVYGNAAGPAVLDSSGEELRTVFITGFPADVKERELNNMLRFLPGYQASQMNWKNGQAQGFALFEGGSAASHAMNMMAHVQFDETSVLRAEMARKNMFVKEDPTQAAIGHAKRARSASYGAPHPAQATTYTASGTAGAVPVAPKGFEQVSNVGDNQPCSTLFVGNLSDDVSQEELHGLFAGQPGFRQIKVVRGARNVTCFVEFEDLQTAMAVHTSLQGAVLQSSARGGIRIQYSKNPLGKRKDHV